MLGSFSIEELHQGKMSCLKRCNPSRRHTTTLSCLPSFKLSVLNPEIPLVTPQAPTLPFLSCGR